jgi:hypothetical protein
VPTDMRFKLCHALQRKVRMAAPSNFIRVGSAESVAALERSLAMDRLSFSEATTFFRVLLAEAAFSEGSSPAQLSCRSSQTTERTAVGQRNQRTFDAGPVPSAIMP